MRKLTLKKETLAELTGEELDLVVAGSGLSCGICVSGIVSCATFRCLESLANC